jgi:DNA-binding transcriptional LysR family regulator
MDSREAPRACASSVSGDIGIWVERWIKLRSVPISADEDSLIGRVMDNLNMLAAFVRAAETLSFVSAGRALGVSASAIGKSIVRLEHELGVKLFHRSTRQIGLTEEGAVFFERCRGALKEIEEAEADLSKAKGVPCGRLKISVPAIGYRLLLPVIPQFRREYPEIELDIDFSDRMVDIINEGFDAVIRGGPLPDSTLTARPLGPYRFIVCASPTYFVERGEPKNSRDLENHVCLRFKYPSNGKLQEWILDGASVLQGARGPARSMQLVLSNTEAVLMAAIQGLGIAYIPDFVANDALAEGKLRRVLDSVSTREGTFRIVWVTNRYMLPKLRVFVDFLGQRLYAGT